MINPKLLEHLQASSVEERISLIEAILQTLKQDIGQQSAVQDFAVANSHPLRGKVLHYEDPYESAAEWEASV